MNKVQPNWTPAQQAIIDASPQARLIVDAGPGTGKTAVLCARISCLLDQAGLEPSEIWIISFTRTAVAEIRTRVSSYLSDSKSAHGIRVATIDSHAWAMNVGFNDDPVLTGSFDENIKCVVETVQKNEHAGEYIRSVKHLFIDEAQDVVGPRVEFVLELIHALSSSAGVTVLCDEAQSIYEYSEIAAAEENLSGNLVENIKEFMPDFQCADFVDVHRTSDPALLDMFLRGRALIRDEGLHGRAKYVQVRNAIVNCSHGKVGDAVSDVACVEDDGALLLFRRRGEALAASARMEQSPHRLRMSGLPPVIADWIGLILWDWVDSRISREEFLGRWARRVPMGGIAKEDAWGRLVRIAGKSDLIVDLMKLRHRLASMSPPLEVCQAEFGSRGPIIGTIHASKGREASEVRLYLPRSDSMKLETAQSFDSEAKILFVGATRAQNRLLVGNSFLSFSARLRLSGRAYTRCANPPWAAQVELGRAGDIAAEGLVGKRYFPDQTMARRAQALVANVRHGVHIASARIGDKDSNYSYAVSLLGQPNLPMLVLAQNVNADLFFIARNLKKRFPPRQLSGLRTLGVRTVAVAPNDPTASALQHPWSESGFMLAPLLIGYGTLQFK